MTRNPWTQTVPAYFYALLIVFLGSIPMGPLLPQQFEYGDKFEHCVAFAVFEVLVYRAVRFSRPMFSRVRGHVLAVVMVSLAGAGLEVWQSVIPWRSSDLLDWVADTVGAFGAALLAMGVAAVPRKAG
ncbi:MAG TPA: VanZ family protein [Polyangiaceae bacterium]|nr:VanZ family protein [Polyangiaceae bacterium]